MKCIGFTLVELLVAMAIMSLLMTLVGPLTLNSVEKSQAKLEVMTLKNWLDDLSYRAFLTQKPVTLELHGKQAVVFSSTDEPFKSVNFKYLYFQPQQIVFNHNGYSAQTQFSYQLNQETILVTLKGFHSDR